MLMLACLSLWIQAGQAQPLQQDTGFGGPSSVTGTLDYDRETEAAVPVRIKLIDRYFDFKKRLEKEYGYGYGFDYNALIQFATESLDDDTAAGGVFRAFGHWTIVGRDTKIQAHLSTRWKTVTASARTFLPRALGLK